MAKVKDEDALILRVDLLIRLQALSLVSNFSSQKEKILFLSKAGMPPKDIGDLLGTTGNLVSVTLSKARKADREVPPSTSTEP